MAQVFGEWRRIEQQSEMTDFMDLYFRVDAENTIPDMFGARNIRPTLWVRCMENRTAIMVDWRRFITSGGIYNQHPVRYRIDDRQAVTTNWAMSTDYEATGLWRGNGIPMLRQMRGATTFIIETTPHGDSTVRARFNIVGIDAVAADIANRCSWSF